MLVYNQTRGRPLARRATLACTFWTRLTGLMGRRELPPDRALILTPCRAIHTCLMRFAIDVVFLDARGKVIYLQEEMPAWRFTPYLPRAVCAVELPPSTIKTTGTAMGDLILITRVQEVQAVVPR
ncbi:MAG: DUF192 domain-containing protein [Desulfurispora sp.]|uniref:DUF192 domain-containing protein n=1 Tax=Desulfurispora sp. TaxID=3014275 RepID=UPI00404B4685